MAFTCWWERLTKALENQLGGFRHSMMCITVYYEKILCVCWHAAKLLIAALRITHSHQTQDCLPSTQKISNVLLVQYIDLRMANESKKTCLCLSTVRGCNRMEQDVWRSTSIRQAGVSNVHDGHDGTMTGLSETSVAFSLFSYCIVFNGACLSSADLKSSCASVAMNTSVTIKWR